MTEEELVRSANDLTRFERHKFLIMVAGTIVISLAMVAISLFMYAKSGAEQLDLSRPGYQAVGREVTQNSQSFNGFPASGPLNQSVANDFTKQYQQEAGNVTKVDAFGGSPLSDQSLGVTSTAQQ
ncbi:MAG TPA: hypothetical protein VFQ70_03090 [Candidatus Saccharimonadaceae bacterium]|nr:hypothetical protein [Candidatus Saccharimonadaceae bacterium]